MKKFITFGDVHFSSINSWNYKAGNNFLNWLEKEDFGNKEDVEIGFVGDITERDTNPGNVQSQLYKLIEICKSKALNTYIIIGNHDRKLYHGFDQHTLEPFKSVNGIHIIEKECDIVTPNGFNVMFLPWQRLDGKDLHDYYNNEVNAKYNKTYDILLAHCQIMDKDSKCVWLQSGIDIDKYKAKCYAIGHIHTRQRKEYIGSIFPNSIAEQYSPLPRCYKEYNSDGKIVEHNLPDFLKYVNINYGDEIPVENDNCAYVYTILKCNSEAEAYDKYPDISIRGIERKEKTDLSEVASDNDIDCNISYLDAFNNMIKETKIPIGRAAYTVVSNYLK